MYLCQLSWQSARLLILRPLVQSQHGEFTFYDNFILWPAITKPSIHISTTINQKQFVDSSQIIHTCLMYQYGKSKTIPRHLSDHPYISYVRQIQNNSQTPLRLFIHISRTANPKQFPDTSQIIHIYLTNRKTKTIRRYLPDKLIKFPYKFLQISHTVTQSGILRLQQTRSCLQYNLYIRALMDHIHSYYLYQIYTKKLIATER